MNSERDTPVLRAARVNNLSAAGSNAMVVAFFWASAMGVMLPQLGPRAPAAIPAVASEWPLEVVGAAGVITVGHGHGHVYGHVYDLLPQSRDCGI
jgi:hypothetical protein